MEVAFFRCDVCKRLDEKREMLKRIERTKIYGCTCGSRRFRPSRATTPQLIWFVIRHPGYLWKAVFGEN